MFAETFDREMLWKLETALTHAFEGMPPDMRSHGMRSRVAHVLAEHARTRECSLNQLVEIAEAETAKLLGRSRRLRV